MNPLNNYSNDSKFNMLIQLVTLLVVIQAITCLFCYKIKENSYVAAKSSIHEVGGSVRPTR